MTINQGAQLKRVINRRKWRKTGARESVKLGAGSTNFESGISIENKLKKKKKQLDACLQGLFKFHIHISRQIWCTFMVSNRNTSFYVLLCYAFLLKNDISNPISVLGIHIELQRFL